MLRWILRVLALHGFCYAQTSTLNQTTPASPPNQPAEGAGNPVNYDESGLGDTAWCPPTGVGVDSLKMHLHPERWMLRVCPIADTL